MVEITKKTREITDFDADAIPFRELLDAGDPVILKGAVKHWPLVAKGCESAADLVNYLKGFYNGRPVAAFLGEPDIGGRFFYNDEMTGRNFEATSRQLDEFLDVIVGSLGSEDKRSYYVGSTDLDQFMPGLNAENNLKLDDPMFHQGHVFSSIWMGNQTTAAAHYDMSNNIACCVAGRRRFTLFPPEEVQNLYPGPLAPTPGGQVVSMVDFREPDFDRYPRFSEALKAGQVADMEPGDMLIYPALWWHQVEALGAFNVLVNYWWNDVPGFIDNPMDTMLHGMLSLRDRPEQEKQAWRALFDYYVFGPSDTAAKHLPEAAQGPLASMDDMTARRMRAQILRGLNR